jgi:hypothetical protein
MLLYFVDVLQISFVGTSERGDHRINDQSPERKNFASFSVPQAIIVDSAKYFVICIFCDL